MHPLQFDATSYMCQGRRLFMISGEIHYFRLEPGQWRDRLEKLKAAGANCVATYVPWLIHEPEEGKFRFEEAGLKVEAFLDLCRELELWAVVRPGPYQYSELVDGGLPTWLCRDYPRILAQDLGGKVFNTSSVSYLHPQFLQKARAWFKQVIPRLARHQVHLGGAVAMAQFDNEMMGIHQWHSGLDYNAEAMGVGREQGPWTEFLKQRYATLQGVASAWDLPLKSWAEALPLAPIGAPSLAQRRRLQDYHDYYLERVADYSEILAGWMREDGLTVPLVHNSPNPESNADFEPVVRRLGKNFVLGSDHYYNLGLDWGNNHPDPKYIVRVQVSLGQLGHLGVPPTVWELPGGSLTEYPPITAHDASCAYLANIAMGMKGYNYYMFAGGRNWPGTGVTGENYEFDAALALGGEKREIYHAQADLAQFLGRHGWLAGAHARADFRVGLTRETSRGAGLGGEADGLDFSDGQVWSLLHKGVLLTAACASLSPLLTDLDSDDWVADTSLPLVLACGRRLSCKVQERLVRFLQNGGKLLVAPVLPELDRDFQPCRVLARALGAPLKMAKLDSSSPRLNAWGVNNVYVNAGLFTAPDLPKGWEMRAREEASGRPAGFFTKVGTRGGACAVLGLNWLQGKREHEKVLSAALGELGCDPIMRKDNPNVWALLRADEGRQHLFLFNFFSSPMKVRAAFRALGSQAWVECAPKELPGVSALVLDEEGREVFRTWDGKGFRAPALKLTLPQVGVAG